MLLYGLICLALLISIILFSNWRVRTKNAFLLPEKYTGVILGNSHAACGFDDQYIDGYINLGAVTESYLYIYVKLKAVLEANPQIKDVIVEVDNMQLSNATMKKWNAGEGAMSRILPKYQPYMTFDESSIIFKGNPRAFITNQQLLMQQNIELLKRPNGDQMQKGIFGRNSRHKTTHADSLLQVHKVPDSNPNEVPNKITVDYLRKIVSLCREKNISLIFVRTPILKAYEGWANEAVFQKFIREQFNDVDFIDLNNLPLKLNEYYDIDHLNIYGSEKLSRFFNDALNDDLFNQPDKQAFIDMRLNSLKSSQDSLAD